MAPKDHKKEGGTRMPSNAIARQHRAMSLREIGGLRQCAHSIGVGWARVQATSQGSWGRSPNQHRRAAPTAVGISRKLSNRTKLPSALHKQLSYSVPGDEAGTHCTACGALLRRRNPGISCKKILVPQPTQPWHQKTTRRGAAPECQAMQ